MPKWPISPNGGTPQAAELLGFGNQMYAVHLSDNGTKSSTPVDWEPPRSYVGGRGHASTPGAPSSRQRATRNQNLSERFNRLSINKNNDEHLPTVVANPPAALEASVAVDGDQMLRKGLVLVGFAEATHKSTAIMTSRFRAHFGVGPEASSKMYSDLIQIDAKISLF